MINFYGVYIMVIMHNMAAMNADRLYKINDKKGISVSEKLASGYRINRAADDAAGISISEKMRRQIRGLSQASLNSKDGISLIQLADGAMNEIHEMLQRGNELCVKAATGTLTEEDRGYIQEELKNLKQEIDELSERTEFNKIKVLQGTKEVEVIPGNGNTVVAGGFPSWATVNNGGDDGYMGATYTTSDGVDHAAVFINFSSFDTDMETKKKELLQSGFYTTCCTCKDHYSIKFSNDATSSREVSGNNYIYTIGLDGVADAGQLIQKIIDGVGNQGNPNGHFTQFAKVENEKKLVIYDNRSQDTTKSGNGYGTFGTGVAYAADDFVQYRQPVDIHIQVGAEAGQRLEIELPEISSLALGIDVLDVSTIEGAESGIGLLDKAIQYVSTERGRMGAYQNRLEHTVANLDNVVENTTAAESQIRDTDMAKAMVEYSNIQIMLQAGQAMLAQANQTKNSVMQLLSQ